MQKILENVNSPTFESKLLNNFGNLSPVQTSLPRLRHQLTFGSSYKGKGSCDVVAGISACHDENLGHNIPKSLS